MAHVSAEFDQLVQALMVEWNVPGLAIAIIQGDEIYKRVNLPGLISPHFLTKTVGLRLCPTARRASHGGYFV
jgi:hypothetical protein